MLRIRQPLLNISSQVVVLDRVESTAQVFLPTVTQAGSVQTITLNLVNSTAQVFLPTIQLVGAVTDTSDILDKYAKRRGLTKKEEEQIAAQLLLERRGKKVAEVKKPSVDWKKLLLDQINAAESETELEAISIPTTESVDLTAQVLAEVERQKEAKRIELEIRRKEAALKAIELEAQVNAIEASIQTQIDEQRLALEAAKQFQIEMAARHKIAVDAALETEKEAFLAAYEAEQKAAEFNKKREQRNKRLKALMWLTKLDI